MKSHRSSNYNFLFNLDDDNDTEYDVYFTYHPPMRGARERSSGIQLSPDDPAEIEIVSILDEEGVECYSEVYTLHSEKIEEAAWEYLEKLRDRDY